jgi:hypothetical protein
LVSQQLHQPAEPQPEATGQLTEPMTASEQKRLVELEGLVTKGLSSFLEVGCALLEIRDTRLYRSAYSSFEHYLRERWDVSRTRGYQLVSAAQIAKQMSTIVDTLPTRESQVRALAGLEPEQQAAVWTAARKQSADPTAAQIEAVREEMFGARTPEPEQTPREPVRALYESGLWSMNGTAYL